MPIEVESPEEMGYSTIQYNLAESSVHDRTIGELGMDLSNVLMNYGHHRGLPELQQAICEGSHILKSEDVLVTAGAAQALYLVATTLLNPEDHLIVVRPNYGTNLETPRGIPCEMSVIDLSFDNGFQPDIDQIQKAIRPNTKLISITHPHNPTGIFVSQSTIESLVQLSERNGFYLLIDETYRHLNFKTPLLPYFAEKSNRVISVSSLSKAFGAPGIRIGWVISRDAKLQHDLLAAKEQMIISNSVVDEYIALQIFLQKEKLLKEVHSTLQVNYQIVENWLKANDTIFEWVTPDAGAVVFPRIKESIQVDFSRFYDRLYSHYHTVVGGGHWFEQSQRYMRIGFGYPSVNEFRIGLENVMSCVMDCKMN
ncbi:MAG: pyridoxal phosphate-dependent aminotransferase [Cyclobacteriaceae bacterium]|nr:pyridoxal phosphate-dependent aminotransferase [Flammeovirgaceae bacterium]